VTDHRDRPRTVIRLGQREFKGYWYGAPALDDRTLAFDHGFVLAGQGRVLDHLLPQHVVELHHYLSDQATIRSQSARIDELLEGAPFVRWVGICEVDACDESEEFLRIGVDATRARTLAWARAIDARGRERGLGLPPWFASNERGGLHADLVAPWSVASPHLVNAAGAIVRDLARELGIPILSELGRAAYGDRSLRPAAYLDDSVLNRGAGARGGQWRLVGGCKPGGFPKTPIDIATGRYLPMRAPNEPRELMDRDALLHRIAKLEELARFEESQRRTMARSMPWVAAAATGAPATPASRAEDEAFVRANPDVAKVWDGPAGDRSLRDYWLAFHALSAGADQDRVRRLLYEMPGSKASGAGKDGKPGRPRDERYVQSTIRSAMSALAKRLPLPPVEDGDEDAAPPADPTYSYSPPEGLGLPVLRAWLAAASDGKRRGAGLDRPQPESVRRATAGALLRLGASEEVVATVLRQVVPELAAQAAASATRARLEAKRPTAGLGALRRDLGALEAWRLARAIGRDLPGLGAPLTQVAVGGGLTGRADAGWLEHVSRTLPETHAARKAVLRPVYCCLMHDERRSNFDGRCLSAKRFVCDSPLCASCWGRRVRTEVELALGGWGEDDERVEGWSKDASYDACWLRGLAGWPAVRRACEALGKTPGAKLRFLGVDPEDGTFTILLVSTAADAVYASSALQQARDRSSKQAYSHERRLTPEQVAARALEVRASWHVWLRRLVEERRGEDLAEAMAASRGKHLVSRSRKALTWPARDALRAAMRTTVQVDEADVHDEEAGFHHVLRHTKTGTVLHVQEHPHAYDRAVAHLRAPHNAEKVGRAWAGMAVALAPGEEPNPEVDLDPRSWVDPPIGPAARLVLGAAARPPT
jgi:hypothetical protein